MAFQVPIYDPDFLCLVNDDPAIKDVQLCYKALPHHQTFCQKRMSKLSRQRSKNQSSLKQFFRDENQPIPIKNEHELAYLFLEEAYNNLGGSCAISKLNMGAILTVLSKAPCFHRDLREKASLVKEKVRNNWLCSNKEAWTSEAASRATSEIEELLGMIPGVQPFNNFETSFHANQFHSNVQEYRCCLRSGQNERIRFRSEKLQNNDGREIYIDRSFRDTNTGGTTTSVRDLLLPNKVVLLRGEAGAGKSSRGK